MITDSQIELLLNDFWSRHNQINQLNEEMKTAEVAWVSTLCAWLNSQQVCNEYPLRTTAGGHLAGCSLNGHN